MGGYPAAHPLPGAALTLSIEAAVPPSVEKYLGQITDPSGAS